MRVSGDVSVGMSLSVNLSESANMSLIMSLSAESKWINNYMCVYNYKNMNVTLSPTEIIWKWMSEYEFDCEHDCKYEYEKVCMRLCVSSIHKNW